MYIFWKTERKIFLLMGLDRGDRFESEGEIGFSAQLG